MKLIENVERCEIVDDGLQFLHSVILYTDGNDIFQARVPRKYRDDEIILAELQGVRIPPENVYPLFDGTLLSSAPDPIPDDCFLKRPNLLYYRTDDASKLFRVRERILEEAVICERLMKSPHRNIAHYLGCHVRDGRIVALCFTKYRETLLHRVGWNDKKLNKNQAIHDIRQGIEHLHSLGYCHNDINPNNIMFDDDDVAVIIDFDSSQPTGHQLSFKTGTQDFNDMSATHSEARNDFYGLNKIEEFLNEQCNLNKSG